MTGIIIGFAAMLTCSCYYIIKSDRTSQRPLIWSLYSLLLVFALYLFMIRVADSLKTPVIWDFTAFYLYGKVASEGLNFYLPENYQLVFSSLHLPFSNFEGLVEEVVNVGCPYPPPTILYLIPLGLLPFKTALVSWTAFNLLFLAGSIYLIFSMFFKSEKLNGLMLVLILFFISSPVRSTISFSQTNFIILFLLLLMKKYSDKNFPGILLTLAFFTKPYMIVFGLFFLLTKRWKAIAYSFLTAVIVGAITLIIIGRDTFMSYFSNNATNRIPIKVFAEQINQSLHAVLLRANLISMDKPYVYLIIAAIIFGISLVLITHILKQKKYDLLWPVLLLVTLLIYPATLNYYGVMLLFITFQFFNFRQPLGLNMYLNIPLIGLIYFLSSFSFFSAVCLMIIIIITISLRQYMPFKLKALISNEE